jgi:hypothetical protein
MRIVDYQLGRAIIMNTSYITRYDSIPVSIRLTGLKRHKINESMTHYVADLLSHFESKGDVTSIRLNYDAKHKRSQNNGFVTFLSQNTAKELANDVTETELLIYDRAVNARLSNDVPMLVRNDHQYIMPTGITAWTNEVENINALIIRHHNPSLHARRDEPEIETGELRERATIQISKRSKDEDSSDDSSVSSKESIKCVVNKKGVTVPFECGMNIES